MPTFKDGSRGKIKVHMEVCNNNKKEDINKIRIATFFVLWEKALEPSLGQSNTRTEPKQRKKPKRKRKPPPRSGKSRK